MSNSKRLSGNPQLWQSVLDAIPSHLAILDEGGTIVAVNRAWRDFARKNGADPATVSEGANYLAVCDRANGVGAEDAKRASAGIRSVLRGEQETFSLDYTCHSLREQRWFKCHVSHFMNEDQAHVMVMHESITKRKQAAANQSFYYNALNASLNEIYMFDANTLRFEFVSQGACHNLGYSLAELRGMTPLDIAPLYNPQTFEALLAPLYNQELRDLVLETMHRRADGSRYPVEVHLQLFEQDDRQVFLAVILDVSDREQAEKALRDSEERYRLLFENNPLSMWIYDPETLRFLGVNNTAIARYGYSRDEFLNMTILDIRPEEEQWRLLQNVRDAQEPYQASGYWTHRKKDGQTIIVEVFSHSIEYTGKPARLVLANDITDRKQAESELHKHAARLALINDVGQKISGVLELQGVLELTARLVHDTFGFYHVALFTFDETTNELVMRARAGQFSDLFPPNHRIKLGSGMVGYVAQAGKRLLANDVQSEPHYANFYPDRLPTASEISLPLRIGERMLGVMDIQSPKSNAFSDADVSVLEILADQVSVAIENSRLYETSQRELEERIRAESALRETEQRYRSLFENSPISLWEDDFSAVKQRLDALKQEGVTDIHTHLLVHPELAKECISLVEVVNVNKTTLELYGVQDKETLFDNLARLIGDTATHQWIIELTNIAEGKYTFGMEATNQKMDGSKMDLSLNWAVVPGYEATLSKVIVSVIDITERKRAEQELQEYHAHLEEVIRERTLELVIARDRAEAASNAKSDFLAVMSHEIRTPLNGVLGLTQLMQQTPLNNKQKGYLARLQFSGETLLATINDILDFSKIESNNMQMESVDFNLDDVLRNLSGLVAYRAQEKGLELVFNTSPDVPRLLVGDPLRLGQVLLNLTGNAIKFTESGEVVVKITLQKLTAEHAALEFSVQDTGIGMTETQMAGLFQPFNQADSSISRKYGGTGLGLTISQRLVNMMGGNISVRSQPGKGATFTFTLEFKQQPHSALARPVTAEALRGLKVLVVDDHTATLDFLKSTLESFSFKVTATNSAKTGLTLLERQPADKSYRLVIIDLSTAGGMDSLQAARAIRQSPSLAHIPIILLLSAEEMLHQVETSILDGYLIKPVTRSQLFDMVMQVFGYETVIEDSQAQATIDDAELLKLRGRKILLVEDNEINQIVAAEILQNMGLQVTVAGSGEEGIWMLNNGKFDAILMDIQMPGMDGYQATSKIRSDPRFTFAKLPVIAMTAHALDSDRTKALDAGLNDYVSKPIDVTRLAGALLRWLTPRKNRKASRASQAANDETESLPGELLKCLDTRPALARLGDNLALYRRILIMFREENATKAQAIRRAIQSNDLPQARRLAHTLKGVGGTIGANILMEAARKLENAILGEQQDAIRDSLELVERHLARVLDATASLEKTVQSTPDSPCASPIASAAPQLQRLAELLTENDAEAVDQMETILAGIQEGGCQDELLFLAQFIRRYDFSNALQQLRALAQKWNLPLAVDENPR